ncbi:Antigen, partial [Armadillidium nasatum]
YTFSLLLVFLLEAIGGIMAYVYEEQVMTDLTDSLSTTFNGKYGEDEAVSEAVDAIQTKYQCCGALFFNQWDDSLWKKSGKSLNNTVPESCCKTPSYLCGVSSRPSNNMAYNGVVVINESLLR